MKVEKITETEFRKMILTSSDRLNKNAEFINSLNVFPVPDGDTGTNMSLSFASGSKYVSESTSANVGDLAPGTRQRSFDGRSRKFRRYLVAGFQRIC